MHVLETYGFCFEPEDLEGRSHYDYKNTSFLFKFGCIVGFDGLSSERFLWVEGRAVCLFVLGIRLFPDLGHTVYICWFYADWEF